MDSAVTEQYGVNLTSVADAFTDQSGFIEGCVIDAVQRGKIAWPNSSSAKQPYASSPLRSSQSLEKRFRSCIACNSNEDALSKRFSHQPSN